MDKINIVIISEFFYPINRIASIRLTKLAKYLSRNYSYEVTVICRAPDLFDIDTSFEKDIKDVHNIIRVKENCLFLTIAKWRKQFNQRKVNKIVRQEKTPETSVKASTLNSIKHKFTLYAQSLIRAVDAPFYRAKAKRQLQSVPKADIILTSYYPKSSSILGSWYKKRFPPVFWIADYRDPVYNQSFTFPFFKYRDMGFVRKVCKNADVITSVSKPFLDRLFFEQHPHKVVLSNGYDKEDIQDIEFSQPSKFTLAYLGTLYFGKQDLSPLFNAIKSLIDSQEIDPNRIIIKYAGSSKHQFIEQSSNYGISNILEVQNAVVRKESLRYQLESHMLILSTWNSYGGEGVVTGKFLEYMMINHPIIALVAGNKKDSVVKEMIGKGNLGFCYEEANRDIDEDLLKEYILRQYSLYYKQNSLSFNFNKKYVNSFDYQHITAQLVSLFPESLQNKRTL